MLKKMLALGVLAVVGGLLPATADETAIVGCTAAAGSSCQFVAGAQGSGVSTPGGELVVGERLSWIATGDWTIEMFKSADCTGPVVRSWSDEANTNVGEIAGANNGGGYYGYCLKASTGADGAVALGGTYSTLLP